MEAKAGCSWLSGKQLHRLLRARWHTGHTQCGQAGAACASQRALEVAGSAVQAVHLSIDASAPPVDDTASPLPPLRDLRLAGGCRGEVTCGFRQLPAASLHLALVLWADSLPRAHTAGSPAERRHVGAACSRHKQIAGRGVQCDGRLRSRQSGRRQQGGRQLQRPG